jgi:desulfoferrodoxin (superoxide reductase-like protein)
VQRRTPDLGRRAFMGLAAASAGLWAGKALGARGPRRLAGDPARLSAFERQHLPVLTLPAATPSGSKVPVVVEMSHPMEPGHFIRSVEIANPRDPIASKGVFHLTPENGRVYLAWQARLGEGRSEVTAEVECNRHGRFSASRWVEVAAGAGGCMAAPDPVMRAGGDDVRGPALRIPELVERGRIRPGEVIRAQVMMRHPSTLGIAIEDGEAVQQSDPLFLEELEVFYCGERVSRFSMTPALSDDPFITFALRARRDGPLRVRLANNRGQRFEAAREIHLG